MTKIINLFGAPCSGKSTHRARIFAEMKIAGYHVEEVTEYAKDIIWEDRENLFEDQLYILAKQNRRISRLIDKVDYVVTDSPLLMNVVYANPQTPYREALKSLTIEIAGHYNNINFFLNRTHEFQQYGRVHGEEHSNDLAEQIKCALHNNGVIFHEYNSNEFDFNQLKQFL